MSGCCGPSPVVIQGPAQSRVDVETLLLCDVLPEGTVAAQVLVEPVYDTTSGDRVATRTVDPVTGAAYTVQGILQQCPESSDCPDCQTFILCDTPQVPTSTAPVTLTGYQVRDDQLISGAPRRGLDTDAVAIWTGQSVSVPGAAPGGSDGGAHTHYGVIVSLDDPACGDLDPAGTVDLTATVTYTNDGPGGGWDWYGRLSMWNGTTLLPDVDNFGQGSGVFFAPGSTRTATITNTVPVSAVLAGDVTIEFDLETGPDQQPDAKTWTVTAGAVTAGPVPVTGCPGTVMAFMRHLCRDCDGAASVTDTALDGTTPYTVAGTVGQCDTETPCASPTEPTATVGLCLADGSPIAVTVVRDCTGTVTSEGWLNLTTGAYSAGAPPAGTIACGDSRSIQVSGTFCDIDPATGDVLGLVLIEYSYDDTGAIASVRLVDATTGDTYTPTGTVTTCPAGVEQPEQDAVVLCDTASDGTVTTFVRDYRRDVNGTIKGHSDYLLDGTTYTPTGTVGICTPPCLHCETVTLCDSAATCALASVTDADWSPRYLTAGDTAAPGVIALRKDVPGGGSGFWGGGSTVFPNVAADPDGGNDGVHYGIAGIVQAADFCPDCIGPDDQVTITASGSATNNGPAGGVFTDGRWRILRDGGEANGAVPQLAQVSDSGRQPNSTWNFTATATVPWSDVFAGRIVLTLDLETRSNGSFKQWTADAFELCITPVTAAGGCGNTFRRTVCRDCSGAIVSTTDYEPDGVTPYTPVGAVGECTTCNPPEVDACQHCETMILCDDGADDTALIGGTTSSGTLSNGVTWQARGSAALQNPLKTNANGAWWNLGTFPNPVITPFTWSFNRPVEVEFSVVLWWSNATPTAASVQIPPNAEPVSLPSGYHYDPATRILSADNTLVDCSTLNNPSPERSARFRMRDAVTSFTLQSLGIRIAACGQFGNWWFGAITVTPTGQFLRTICRDCTGTVTSSKDTGLDGITPYTVFGAPKVCTPPEPADCCQPVQVCIADTVTETVEFISNEAQIYDNAVDTVWTWTPNGDANGPAPNATWYQTYRARFAPNPAAWSVVDTAPVRKAGWIAPHPNGLTGSSNAPGEGPTLSGPEPWWARASFSLPAAADPASIKVQITVLNADQQAIRFRLNSGAWTALPASASHNGTPYTFGPGTVAGAQPGTNTLYFEVNETLPDTPTNGAGVMAHFIVTYDVPGLGQRSWTRMVCCDGSVYYLDENGDRQDTLPPSSSLVACGGSPDPLVLCDDLGTFLRHVSYLGEQIITTDTDLNGTAYTPTGPVRDCSGSSSADDCTKQVVERCGCDDTDGDSLGDVEYTELWAVDPCNGAAPVLLGTYEDGDLTKPYTPTTPVECTTADALPGPLSTGVRAVTGTAAQNIAGSFPGLQSVSLTVLAGPVNVTMSDGTAVPVPAGVTLTWSVAQDEDTALAVASFAGAAASASYLLNWTFR